MKIYTRTGDEGTTGLFGGARVPKDHPRIEAYGSVDELNAALGIARSHASEDARLGRLSEILRDIQADLFVLGADLATPDDARTQPPRIAASHIVALEFAIDAFEEDLVPLKNFVLPAGTHTSASLHFARTVARRSERDLMQAMRTESVEREPLIYLNRLSDLLFVLARWANHRAGEPDELWQAP